MQTMFNFFDSDSTDNLIVLKQRVECTLQSALGWFVQNTLKINPNKTELLVIKSQKKRCDPHLTIRFGDSIIKPSSSAKILGIYVDSALTWEKQVSQVVRRCFHVLVGLSKLRHKIPSVTKKLLIEALVFPYLTYCCTVWGGCSTVHRNRLQKVINFAVRIVAGLKRHDHVTPAREALGWPRFDDMLEERDIALIRRLTSDGAPPALSNIVQRRSDVSQRCTRGTVGDMLDLPKIETERARRHFPFRSVTSWNCRQREGK